jgi:hypothetical protein
MVSLRAQHSNLNPNNQLKEFAPGSTYTALLPGALDRDRLVSLLDIGKSIVKIVEQVNQLWTGPL